MAILISKSAKPVICNDQVLLAILSLKQSAARRVLWITQNILINQLALKALNSCEQADTLYDQK